MDIRPITPSFSVSPQIEPGDIAAIAEAGYTTIICNRPDSEVPAPLQAAAVAEAAEAAGLAFVVNPVVHTAMTQEIVARQRDAIAGSQGPALAYCQSGTRSTVLWMLSEARATPSSELIETAGRAGYQLAALKPQLDALYEG